MPRISSFYGVFLPLRDLVYFARMTLDPVSGTVVLPDGADFAPEALHEMSKSKDHASA